MKRILTMVAMLLVLALCFAGCNLNIGSSKSEGADISGESIKNESVATSSQLGETFDSTENTDVDSEESNTTESTDADSEESNTTESTDVDSEESNTTESTDVGSDESDNTESTNADSNVDESGVESDLPVDTDVESATDSSNEENEDKPDKDEKEGTSILVVDGDFDTENEQTSQIEGSDVFSLFKDCQAIAVAPQNLPMDIEKLVSYDKIMLMNVDFGKLPKGADVLLKTYVEECGGELFLSFGENFYEIDKNEYNNSEFNKLLPVDLTLTGEKEAASIIYVLDLSTSMRTLMGEKSRFDTSLDGLKAAIMLSNEEGGLEDTDYVGVVCFDADAKMVLDLTQLGDEMNREQIWKMVERELKHYYYYYYLNPDGTESEIPVGKDDGEKYTAAGYIMPDVRSTTLDYQTGVYIRSYGTQYKWAIQTVAEMFERQAQNVHCGNRRVLFMSDGAPSTLAGYKEIVERMADGGVEFFTLAVGLDLDSNKATVQMSVLQDLADIGNGKCFLAENTDDVIYHIENSTISVDRVTERIVSPKINVEDHPVLENVGSELVEIGGYYTSIIKDGAELVIYVDNVRPLYAEWEYGTGKVSVFMSDLGNESWTGKLLNSDGGLYLLYNMMCPGK